MYGFYSSLNLLPVVLVRIFFSSSKPVLCCGRSFGFFYSHILFMLFAKVPISSHCPHSDPFHDSVAHPDCAGKTLGSVSGLPPTWRQRRCGRPPAPPSPVSASTAPSAPRFPSPSSPPPFWTSSGWPGRSVGQQHHHSPSNGRPTVSHFSFQLEDDQPSASMNFDG